MKIAAKVLSRATLRAFRRSVLRSAGLVVLVVGTALGTVVCSFAQDDSVPALDIGSDDAGSRGAPPSPGAAPPNAPGAPPAVPGRRATPSQASAGPASQTGASAAASTGVSASRKQSADVASAQLAPFFQITRTLPDVDGEPLALDRLLYGTSSPAERFRRLDAYWDLSGKYALVVLCARNQADVNACVNKVIKSYSGNLPADVKALAVSARDNAKQAYDSARLTFVQAQYDFDAAFSTPAGRRAAMNRSLDAPNKTTRFFGTDVVVLYIPSVAPATEFYQTRYEEIARQRRASAEAARLNAMTPLLYETLQSRASQASAERSLLEAEFKSESSGVASLFAAVDRYFAAQKEAIAAAVKYNRAIAAYSCETVPGSLRGDRLLATLNQRPAAQTSSSDSQTPRPAQSAPRYNDRYGYGGLVLPGLDGLETARTSFATANYRAVRAGVEPYAGLVLPGLLETAPLVERTLVQVESATISETASVGVLSELGDSDVDETLLADASASALPASLIEASYLVEKPVPADQDAALREAERAAEEETVRQAAEEAARKAAEEEAAKKAAEEAARKAAEEEAAKKAAEEAARKAAEEEAAKKAVEEAARKAAEEEATKKAAEEAARKAAEEDAAKKAEATALQEQSDAFPTVITGYEQPDYPRRRSESATTVRPVGDGAYWRLLDAELESFFAEVASEPVDEEGDDSDSSVERVVRGQQTSVGSAPSYETARKNAANEEAENAEREKIYRRVQQIVEIYFAPVQPKTDERTGVSERGLSLVNALSNAPGVPAARFEIAKTYWLLQGAVAALRVENLTLAQYAAALNSNPNDKLIAAQALGAQARQTAGQTKVRELQIKLLRLTNVSPGYGYPVPTTAPFCGKKFDLGNPRSFNANMRRTVGLIPERLKVAQDLSGKLNAPQDMLKLDSSADAQTSVATLEKNRELIMSYIGIVVDLNVAIAEYVAYFPARVSNEQFVKALSGKDL